MTMNTDSPEYLQPSALADALEALGTDLGREAAVRLRYFDGQDSQLNQAQEEILRLRDSLQDMRRPMTDQMERQNRTIVALNLRLMWFGSYVGLLQHELRARGGTIPAPLIPDPGGLA